MELNAYALEVLARDRIERARAQAACRALARRAVARRPLRGRLGAALVVLGQRLLADATPPLRGVSPAP
jgi:hypothetical protein